MKDLVIIGAGGFGREVADTVQRINSISKEYNLIGFIDDNEDIWNITINGYEVIGGIDFLKNNFGNKVNAVVAIASADEKKNIVSKLNDYVEWENIIDPTALVSKSNVIGKGNIIQPFSVIGPNTIIGNHCVINLRGSIGHDAVLDDYVAMMSMCDVTGYVHLKEGVYLGSSVCIIPSIVVREYSIIGAGSTVIKNIMETGTYAGSPAKRIK